MVYFVSDFDGTLSHDFSLSSQTINQLKMLEFLGLNIIIATGRPIIQMNELLETYGLDFDIIGQNGAEIKEKSSEKSRLISSMNTESVIYYVNRLINEKIPLKIYTEREIFCYDSIIFFDELKGMAQEKTYFLKNIIMGMYYYYDLFFEGSIMFVNKKELYKKIHREKVTKIEAIAKKSTVNRLIKELESDGICNAFVNGNNSLEISPSECTKGTALEFILNSRGDNNVDVIGAGNSYNDISFFEKCNLTFASDVAINIIKRKATEIFPVGDLRKIINMFEN